MSKYIYTQITEAYIMCKLWALKLLLVLVSVVKFGGSLPNYIPNSLDEFS